MTHNVSISERSCTLCRVTDGAGVKNVATGDIKKMNSSVLQKL